MRGSRPGRKQVPAEAKASDAHVLLITAEQHTYEVPHEIVGRLSTYWYYAFRHRRRWYDSAEALQSLATRAIEGLTTLGIPRENLVHIGSSRLVEVRIPFASEELGWAARILPWEFLLRVSTRRKDLPVIRHLDLGVDQSAQLRNPPKKLLFVESAPGQLNDFYTFNTERWLVERSLRLATEEIRSPTSAELQARVQAFKPDIIHLAGVDLHEGDTVLEYSGTDDVKWDGFYLAGSLDAPYDRVVASRLGSMVNPPGGNRPFVSCNFYYSASRVAPMIVANGARAAFGFLDEVDNALAERYFATFYQQWKLNDWDLLAGFEKAWKKMAAADPRGMGLVLWSCESLLKTPSEESKRAERRKPIELVGAKENSMRVEVEPNTEINYSCLHNGEGLFRKFCVYKYEPSYPYGIRVHVSLNMGTESFPYEASFDLESDEPVLDIAERVNLPLTSQLARSLKESVQTSLTVRVKCHNRYLYNETHRVTLLPVNEWEFDDESGIRWLGSFVLPGDAAVRKVIDAGQKYLMALQDDSGAGFDGYQRVGEDAENPDECVDLQVRAIWSALSYDFSLNLPSLLWVPSDSAPLRT